MILTDQKAKLITHNINLDILENIGRTCYDSMDKKTNTSYLTFFKNLLKNKHESILEHCSLTFEFKTNRAIANELVRHRLASYTQSSTRYIKYNDYKTEFIIPSNLKDNIIIKNLKDKVFSNEKELETNITKTYFKFACNSSDPENQKAELFAYTCFNAENNYIKWLKIDSQDQGNARDILPLGLATTLIMTCNLREFMHIYKLRYLGTTGTPHKHIQELIGIAVDQIYNDTSDKNNYAKIFFDAAIELAKKN